MVYRSFVCCIRIVYIFCFIFFFCYYYGFCELNMRVFFIFFFIFLVHKLFSLFLFFISRFCMIPFKIVCFCFGFKISFELFYFALHILPLLWRKRWAMKERSKNKNKINCWRHVEREWVLQRYNNKTWQRQQQYVLIKCNGGSAKEKCIEF